MAERSFQQTVEAAAAAQDEKAADAIIDTHIRILSATYEKAIAYTNLIVLAGYASFFGLWQLTKDDVTKQQSTWAALFILSSAVVFVMFEVTKMYVSSLTLRRLNKTITDPAVVSSAARLIAALEEVAKEERRVVVAVGYWWHFALAVTVLTGLIGTGIMAYAFVSALWQP